MAGFVINKTVEIVETLLYIIAVIYFASVNASVVVPGIPDYLDHLNPNLEITLYREEVNGYSRH